MDRTILIKLGNTCNFSCKHCHCSALIYQLNPKIIPFIRDSNCKTIVFSGGEPLMYIDTIKYIVNELKDLKINYRFVTNGSFLSDEIIKFFNDNSFFVSLSYDGSLGNRDQITDDYFHNISKLRKRGLAVTVYKDNMNFSQLDCDVISKLNMSNIDKYFPHFIHQTGDKLNYDQVDDDVVDNYIRQMRKRLELEIRLYKVLGKDIRLLYVLYSLTREWFSPKDDQVHGFTCCSEFKTNLTISGDIMLCPYGTIKIGNIDDGVDWDYVESFKPDRCKCCELWKICHNRCIANVTDNECKIFKALHHTYQNLLKDYSLNFNELLQDTNGYNKGVTLKWQ